MKISALFEHTILAESFKDAQQVFAQEGDPAEVSNYIQKFRELSNEQKIRGPEKDITSWIKKGFAAFKQFVQNAANQKSGKEQKRDIKSSGAVKIAEYPNYTVIAPLNKAASCEYGSGTKWCTSATENNKFDQYFHGDDTELFYLMPKKGGQKYAVAFEKSSGQVVGLYDSQDRSMDEEDFKTQTGIDAEADASQWSSRLSPSRPTPDTAISGFDSDDAFEYWKKHKNQLNDQQIAVLQKKISQNPDNLVEYCRVASPDDQLVQSASKIFMDAMMKSSSAYNQYLAYMEDYVNYLKARNPYFEHNFGAISAHFNQERNPRVREMAKEYVTRLVPQGEKLALFQKLVGFGE